MIHAISAPWLPSSPGIKVGYRNFAFYGNYAHYAQHCVRRIIPPPCNPVNIRKSELSPRSADVGGFFPPFFHLFGPNIRSVSETSGTRDESREKRMTRRDNAISVKKRDMEAAAPTGASICRWSLQVHLSLLSLAAFSRGGWQLRRGRKRETN